MYEGIIYLFCNLGVAWRTGHDYNNHWDDNGNFIWYGKTGSRLKQPLIKHMLNSSNKTLIFTRTDSSLPYIYEGRGSATGVNDKMPVEIIWSFKEETFNHPTTLPEEINNSYSQGHTVKVTVNKYERNRTARQICIDYYGCYCQICNFNFEASVGDVGSNFIHVHHLKQLSEIKNKYLIDPIKDLIPVCPNCHAIIHRRNPAYTIDEVKSLISANKNN